MQIRLILALFFAVAPFAATHATIVTPPEFPELVAEADAIYRGRVAAVQARRIERPAGGGLIKTYVTIEVDRVLKGPEQKEVTLEFLGGTIGDETLEVGGIPHFTVGERGIVFVQGNGRQFCPIARLAHGRYHVKHDETTGDDRVTRDNHEPLRDVAQVKEPMSENAATNPLSRALTVAAFETQIRAEVDRQIVNERPD